MISVSCLSKLLLKIVTKPTFLAPLFLFLLETHLKIYMNLKYYFESQY